MAVTVYSQSEPLVDSLASPTGGLVLRALLRSQMIAMATVCVWRESLRELPETVLSLGHSQELCVQFKACRCWSGG